MALEAVHLTKAASQADMARLAARTAELEGVLEAKGVPVRELLEGTAGLTMEGAHAVLSGLWGVEIAEEAMAVRMYTAQLNSEPETVRLFEARKR